MTTKSSQSKNRQAAAENNVNTARLTPEREKYIRQSERAKDYKCQVCGCDTRDPGELLAEIDALRAELKSRTENINALDRATFKLIKERDRLREALEPFAKVGRERKLSEDDVSYWAFKFMGRDFALAAKAVAQAAQSQEEK